MTQAIYSSDQILSKLPVRRDFLMIDRAQILDDSKIIGLRAVTMNELNFIGHFPGHPIFPGVLQTEAVFQLAELLLRDRLDPAGTLDFYIQSLRRVKFRKPNNPGDRLLIEVQVTELRETEAKLTATVRNGSGISGQSEMTVAVRERHRALSMPTGFNEFDKTDAIELDVVKIMDVMPHRFPFLFVDYVLKMEGGSVTAVKNATACEPCFRVYEDGYTVMTGSVHPEIGAQAGCIHMLSGDAMKGKIAYFMGIEESEFFAPVHPGDQLCLKVDMPDNTKRFGKGEGHIFVDGTLVSRTIMSFAIVEP